MTYVLSIEFLDLNTNNRQSALADFLRTRKISNKENQQLHQVIIDINKEEILLSVTQEPAASVLPWNLEEINVPQNYLKYVF